MRVGPEDACAERVEVFWVDLGKAAEKIAPQKVGVDLLEIAGGHVVFAGF